MTHSSVHALLYSTVLACAAVCLNFVTWLFSFVFAVVVDDYIGKQQVSSQRGEGALPGYFLDPKHAYKINV